MTLDNNIQQRDVFMLQQTSKELFVKIQLMNKDFSIIDELNGVTLSGSISIDANSDIRRTYSSIIHVKDKTLLVGEKKKIWLDKYIRVFIGIKDVRSQEVIYYPLGIFLFNDNVFTFNETTSTLSITCVDLMSKMTGMRSGYLDGLSTIIPSGSYIRDVIVSTVSELGGFQKYIVQDIGKSVPYDLKFSAGATVFDIIKALRDLYPAWETFFTIDGTFVCQEIPTCEDDNIVLDSTTISKLVISEALANSFSEIKNKTEVWGSCLSSDRFSEICTNTDNQFNIVLDNFELKERMKIAFKPNVTSLENPTLKINELSAYGIYNESNEPIPAARLKVNKAYVVQFLDSKFRLLGEFQTYGVAMDNNPDSPFYVGDNQENINLQVLSDGEYAHIPSDDLCQERAEYENWVSTRLTDSIDLVMVLVPWLDVNRKIEYTSYLTGETSQYITKSINFDFSAGTMNVHCIKFYPLYPSVVKTHQISKGVIL